MDIIALDRHNTNCLKWDSNPNSEMLSMWVADTEFEAEKKIIEALHKRVDHGIYGYSTLPSDYKKTVVDWMKRRYSFDTIEDEIVPVTGNVVALKLLVQTFTEIGDYVLIQSPVYYMFNKSIEINNRKVLSNDLLFDGNKYSIDFDDLEKKIIENRVKLFILCNPHNPVGRVFTKEELKKIGSICIKHNVIIASDEVHADFAFARKHIPFTKAVPKAKDLTIVMTGPNKTFNLAGLKCGNLIIHNEELRSKFIHTLDSCGIVMQNIFSIEACKAAYTYGDDYVDSLREKIYENIQYLDNYTQNTFPVMKVLVPEGTYLVWIDIKDLSIPDNILSTFLKEKANVWLDEGNMFGKQGAGYIRINVACPIEHIKEAVDRIKQASIDEGYYKE